MTDMKLSKTMKLVLALIQRVGSITRYPGGFWGDPSTLDDNGIPKPYYNTNTLLALENRGLIAVSKYSSSSRGAFAVEYQLTNKLENICIEVTDEQAAAIGTAVKVLLTNYYTKEAKHLIEILKSNDLEHYSVIDL